MNTHEYLVIAIFLYLLVRLWLCSHGSIFDKSLFLLVLVNDGLIGE